MEQHKKHIDDLSEIRSMMEKASKFISLSGLSGVMAGVFALLGGGVAYWYIYLFRTENTSFDIGPIWFVYDNDVLFLLFVAAFVFLFAMSFAIFFTTRNSKKKGMKLWDHTSKKMIFNLVVPVLAGVFFVMALIYYGYFQLVLPATLIFYGLALINGGHFTYSDIRYLGYIELVIGFLSIFLFRYTILIWCISFGVLHIIYGILMYLKYEKV